MAVKFLDDGDPDGTTLGQAATSKISFYGATPVVQPSGAAQAAVSTATFTPLITAPTATDIAIAVNALITRVEALTTLGNANRSAMVTLGLSKGSA